MSLQLVSVEEQSMVDTQPMHRDSVCNFVFTVMFSRVDHLKVRVHLCVYVFMWSCLYGMFWPVFFLFRSIPSSLHIISPCIFSEEYVP